MVGLTESASQPRVVHVINEYTVKGGAQKQLHELVARSDLVQDIVALEGRSLRALRLLRSRLTSRAPDLVVAWLDRAQISVACVAGPGWRTAASVCSVPRRPSARSRWLLRGALARYDHVITNTKATSEALESFMSPLPARASIVIPNGVEDPGPAQHQLPAEPPRIAFIGRASEKKGVDVLLAAIATPDFPAAEVTLVGAGVPEFVAETGIAAPGVRALGEAQDPWREIQACDVLVVPSRVEGSPNVVLEAFMRGIPVIASAVGGTSELLANGRGLLVPPEDPGALVQALNEMLGDRRSAYMRADRARAYAKSSHDWDRVTVVWDQTLRQLAGV